MKGLRLGFAALALLTAAAAAAGEKAGEVEAPPGATVESAPDALRTRYVLFRPAGGEGVEAARAAVILLSRGDRAELSETLLKEWLAHAARHRFILLYLSVEGTPDRGAADLARVLAALDDAGAKAAVDPGRVCLAGFGHGACAAWDAAMRRPELFRAVVSVNGVSLRRLCAPATEVACYLVQGAHARVPVAVEQGRAADAALTKLRAGHVWREVELAGDEVADYAGEMRLAAEWLAKLEPREGEARTCEAVLAARLALVRVRAPGAEGMTPAEVEAVLGPAQGRSDLPGDPPQHALVWSRDLARARLHVVLFEARGGREEAVRAFVQEPAPPPDAPPPGPRIEAESP